MVRPGHYLDAGPGQAREVRYWYPPDPDEQTSYAAHCEAFRGTFERAVSDRLESARPLIAHSSGGYDSSSILLVAERIYRSNAALPSLVMASALCPGMPSDESHLMDAVARRVRFESYRWSALEPNTTDIDDPSLVRPGMGRGIGGGPRGDVALAHERGARVLVAGHLGDTVMHAWGLRRDLFRRGRWGLLVRHTIGRHGVQAGGRMFGKAGLGALPPSIALSLGERMSGRRGPPPSWFGPRLREIYSTAPDTLGTIEHDWRSHVACELWARVTSAQVSACIDGPVQAAASDGLELRMPYGDVRLIECALKIPTAQRIRNGGSWALRHDALGGLMPDEFRTRQGQPSWEPMFARAARHAFPRVSALLSDGDWLSSPFCDRAEVGRWLAALTRAGEKASARDCITVADLGAVEAWLRRLLRYDTAPRWRDE